MCILEGQIGQAVRVSFSFTVTTHAPLAHQKSARKNCVYQEGMSAYISGMRQNILQKRNCFPFFVLP
jgi:hypothetical protein